MSQFFKEKKCKQGNKTPIKFRNLTFLQCVFFSNQQYNKDEIYKPKNSLYIENVVYVSKTTDVENYINSIIDYVYNKLNENNKTGTPYKVPMPIFAMIGRKLDYTGSIFQNETFKHVPTAAAPSTYNFGKAKISTDKNGNLAILDYINAFLSSDIQTSKDINKYNTSLVNRYGFNGNIKISIYIPYLTNSYKYITNFVDVINASRFFYTLIDNDNFLSMKRTSKYNIDEIRNDYKKRGLSDANINRLIKSLINNDIKKYPLYDDLYNLCYDGGCISNIGEDYETLLPAYTDDDGKNNENSDKFSPFMPNKCLSKTNGFICNIQYAASDNVDIATFLKKYSMEDIKKALNKYSEVAYNISKGGNSDTDEVDKNKSPIDMINNIVNRVVIDGYSRNLNNKDGNGYNYNHYSIDYSQNIIKELILLNKIHPGVPEITASLYLINDNYKTDKIIFMPWGKYLISPEYVLNLGEILPVYKKIFSYNNRFALMIDGNGYIYVYDVNTRYITYFINYKRISNPKGLIVETTGLTIQYTDSNNNLKTKNVDGMPTEFIKDCDDCKEPYSLLLDNDTGKIVIYGNSFLNVTNNNFANYINNNIYNITKSGRNISVDSLLNKGESTSDSDSSLNINANGDIDILKSRDFIYCDNTRDSCSQ